MTEPATEWVAPLPDCPAWCESHAITTFSDDAEISAHHRTMFRVSVPAKPELAAILLYLSELRHIGGDPEWVGSEHPPALAITTGGPNRPPSSLTFVEAERMAAALTEAVRIIRDAAEAWCECGEPMLSTERICWRCQVDADLAERRDRREALTVVKP